MNRAATRDLEHLADTLWAERHVVEYLLFKLLVAKLILAADERRFVSHALEDVERVVEALREAELRRAVALEAVAAEWQMPAADLTLSELTAKSPEPMRSVFMDHRKAFNALTAEIEETAAANRNLASASLSHVQATLDALTGPSTAATYTASGRHDKSLAAPMSLDEVL